MNDTSLAADRETINRIMAPAKYETHKIVRQLVAVLAVARVQERERCARISSLTRREERDRLDNALAQIKRMQDFLVEIDHFGEYQDWTLRNA